MCCFTCWHARLPALCSYVCRYVTTVFSSLSLSFERKTIIRTCFVWFDLSAAALSCRSHRFCGWIKEATFVPPTWAGLCVGFSSFFVLCVCVPVGNACSGKAADSRCVFCVCSAFLSFLLSFFGVLSFSRFLDFCTLFCVSRLARLSPTCSASAFHLSRHSFRYVTSAHALIAMSACVCPPLLGVMYVLCCWLYTW